jgi:hypothetical protein
LYKLNARVKEFIISVLDLPQLKHEAYLGCFRLNFRISTWLNVSARTEAANDCKTKIKIKSQEKN